jgi:hypothetical protein
MKKSSPVVIIVAVVMGILLLCGGVAVAGLFIFKNKVTNVIKSDEAQSLIKEVKDTAEDANSDDNSSVSNLKPACDYYTKAEAELILGDTVSTSQTAEANKDDTTCMYAVDLSTGKFAMTTFVIADTKSTTRQSFAAAKRLMDNKEQNKVKDVSVSGADEAFWVETVYQLNVLKDGKWMIFSTYAGSDVTKYQDITTKQAELILKKF